ncbi:MAG: NAD(P)H-dependent glycerol-3-phosphate dehydrogenase [Gemmatimonadota bacterium]|nr:NAD(P)H-dependent glycerol-3-phosphate dehydrogenase [Gemmatimonadota bacterium]
MKTAVIGAGSWGTTLADLLAKKGEEVHLWAFEPEVAEQISSRHVNELFLPGVSLSEKLRVGTDLGQVVSGAEVVVMVCPCHVMRSLLEQLAGHLGSGIILVNASKGLETKTLLRMSQVEQEVLPSRLGCLHVTLSGPSFALEVAKELPTVVTAASQNGEVALKVQELFSAPHLRVYTHDDIIGVELGGALKNVIAIATGMLEGLGLGNNTRAALITRGLVEITRLGLCLGAKAQTLSGIAGLGDLVLTCTGHLSRNRQLGLRIGQGEQLDEITGSMRAVAEGIRTTKAAYRLALKHGIDMPITEQVYNILFNKRSVRQAVDRLMKRELRNEYDR